MFWLRGVLDLFGDRAVGGLSLVDPASRIIPAIHLYLIIVGRLWDKLAGWRTVTRM